VGFEPTTSGLKMITDQVLVRNDFGKMQLEKVVEAFFSTSGQPVVLTYFGYAEFKSGG